MGLFFFLLCWVPVFLFCDKKEDTIIEEWESIEIPPAPQLKSIEVDVQTTALLVLDFQYGNCNSERRPRCVASLPRIQKLLSKARSKNMTVIHAGRKDDIRKEVAPREDEPVVRSGVDKFYETELESHLDENGIQTVIIIGTSAHGAVLHTATGAAKRGYQIIVPVDGLSSSHPYAEQYTAWHLVNGPGTRRRTTLTRIDSIQFSK